jgi:hypothetical protein
MRRQVSAEVRPVISPLYDGIRCRASSAKAICATAAIRLFVAQI